jgi:hypothetical protein
LKAQPGKSQKEDIQMRPSRLRKRLAPEERCSIRGLRQAIR